MYMLTNKRTYQYCTALQFTKPDAAPDPLLLEPRKLVTIIERLRVVFSTERKHVLHAHGFVRAKAVVFETWRPLQMRRWGEPRSWSYRHSIGVFDDSMAVPFVQDTAADRRTCTPTIIPNTWSCTVSRFIVWQAVNAMYLSVSSRDCVFKITQALLGVFCTYTYWYE